MQINTMQLQQLGWFNNAVHSVEHTASSVGHTIVHVADMAAPDMKWAAGETWKGVAACYASAPCKAAAEKYGTKAVEAGMKSAALQNLNWFSGAEHWVSGAAKTVEHGVVTAADDAAPILKMVGQEAWKGATACYADAACKAAVEKYGLKAVEAAEKKNASLQNLNWFSGAESWVSGAAKTVEHGVVTAADDAAPILKMVGQEAWKGATACYADAACKAAVEKYGLEAVEAAMKKKALMELFSFDHWVSGAAKTVEHGVVKAADKVEPIAKYAAGKAWTGTKACYASAPCKASVEKIGLEATMAAFALQNLNFSVCESANPPSYCKFMGGGNQPGSSSGNSHSSGHCSGNACNQMGNIMILLI